MSETVLINGLTLCHKNSTGFVSSTLPDVCKSPDIPAPYTITSFASTLVDGTTTVLSHGGAMNGVLGSRFATCLGNEPGVGGGVVSGVNMQAASFIGFSPTVFMEGKPVTRLTDKMLMNNGNTVSAGGYFTDRPAATALKDEICAIACQCQEEGNANQACVDLALTALHGPTNTKADGVFPEARYKLVGGKYQLDRDPATGMPNRGGPFRRPDVTRLSGGKVAELVEIKFKNNGDRYRGNQQDVYDQIALDNNVEHETVNLPDDCTCEEKPEKKPVDVPVTDPDEESNYQQARNWASDHSGAILVGAVVVTAVALIVVTGGGAAALALAL